MYDVTEKTKPHKSMFHKSPLGIYGDEHPENTPEAARWLPVCINLEVLLEKVKGSQSTPQTKASYIASLLFSNWLVLYGILEYIFTDNTAQFFSKVFEKLCTISSIKHLTTTTYHLEMTRKDGRGNKTIIARLYIHVEEYHRL